MQLNAYKLIKHAPKLLLNSLPLVFIIGCQTSSSKTLKVQKVADQQVILISKIQSQRQNPQMIKFLSQNDMLRSAEMDLNQALDAIKEASAEIANQLSLKCTKNGGNDE